jgi:hypothetical protein
MPTFYLVELFSGSSSVARGVRAGLPSSWKLKTLSVDINPKYNPTVATDILTWKYRDDIDEFLAPAREGDVVFVHASPPCTEYSRAKSTGVRDLETADAIVKRSLRIVRYARPDYWSLENPVGLLRTRPFMKPLQKYQNTTSYCKFGLPFRKNTDLWSNVPDLELPVCTGDTPCAIKKLHGRHPQSAQTGQKTSEAGTHQAGSGGRENVYPLPKRLVKHVVRAALKHRAAKE